MNNLKKFALLIKPGCKNCEFVSKYLQSKVGEFEVWNVEDEAVVKRLLQDPKFAKKFCNIEECYSDLPAIRLAETGEYYFGEDLMDFKRFYTINKLLEIEDHLH
ncbi:MAG: hypothetical protein JW776_07355 [Candidatus Lokiarchaeota archaeon]|nr:hypothetical protein [Candidatus Lokiarchaeota archaeon]